MRIFRILVLVVAIAAFAMLLASGPGTRAGWWTWQTGLALLQWAAYAGLAAGIGASLLIAALAVPRWRAGRWLPLTALILAVIAVTPPLLMMQKAKGLPYIHDITTDPFDPPAFVSLLEMRRKTPNGADYGGTEVAAQQQKGYPDIKSLVVKGDPAATLQRAIDAARACGWDIISMDAPSGRIEATDTTAWFGFKDDIVVRVRPDAAGSRVDVRSVSRVGLSDVGANAKRIREFLGRLA